MGRRQRGEEMRIVRQALDLARAWWWHPILAGCALLLGKAGLVRRAYAVVFGDDWYVVTNGEFSHLRLIPRRRRA